MENNKYVIMGSNKNPLYLDFWPIVSKVWKEKFNITPVLGLIDDIDSNIEQSEYGLVKRFKSVDNIDTGLLSQIIRLYLPKYLDGICLVSDIDMIPLSVNYFNESLSYVTNNNMVIFSSNHPQTVKNKMFPMCYIAAHSNVYKEIFDLGLDWEGFSRLLFNRNEEWYTDQKYLFERAIDFDEKTNRLVLLQRKWGGPMDNRVDRANWVYSPQLVKQGHYIDCHTLRPYSKYKYEIDKLIELL